MNDQGSGSAGAFPCQCQLQLRERRELLIAKSKAHRGLGGLRQPTRRTVILCRMQGFESQRLPLTFATTLPAELFQLRSTLLCGPSNPG